jgi:hypothetical protein
MIFSCHKYVYPKGGRAHLKHKIIAQLMTFMDMTAIDNVHRRW